MFFYVFKNDRRYKWIPGIWIRFLILFWIVVYKLSETDLKTDVLNQSTEIYVLKTT